MKKSILILLALLASSLLLRNLTDLTYAIYINNSDMVKSLLINGAKITDYDGIDYIYETAKHDSGALLPLFSKYRACQINCVNYQQHLRYN